MNRNLVSAATVVAMALCLGLVTTAQYVRARGISYLEQGAQIRRHQEIMEGRAGDPWQYRVLSAFLVDQVMTRAKSLQVPHPIAVSFILFRVVQDTAIVLLAFLYYRKLKLSSRHALVGMFLLAWGISHSHHGSDFQFNTFFDITFYLLAGLCTLAQRYRWIVPITILAALNRETSALIPVFPVAVAFVCFEKDALRRTLPVCVMASASFVAVFIGLRLLYQGQELIVPYGHQPGFDLFWFNISRPATWERLVATLSFIPVLAAYGYKTWPLQLRTFFWVIVPIWILVHCFGSVMSETRLFLVPQALVFIPGMLFLLQQTSAASARNPSSAGAASGRAFAA